MCLRAHPVLILVRCLPDAVTSLSVTWLLPVKPVSNPVSKPVNKNKRPCELNDESVADSVGFLGGLGPLK